MKQERFKNLGTTNLQCWPMSAQIQYGMLHGGFHRHVGLGKQWRAGVRKKNCQRPSLNHRNYPCFVNLPTILPALQARALNARNRRECYHTQVNLSFPLLVVRVNL